MVIILYGKEREREIEFSERMGVADLTLLGSLRGETNNDGFLEELINTQ